jgi:hypothetical protein
MNWGKWIAAAFVSFAVFIGGLVIVCVREDVSLVSQNYYQEELDYEDQIVRLNNTMLLSRRPLFEIVGDSLVLLFPDIRQIQSGDIVLFRPSDAELDRSFQLIAGGSPVRYFSLKALPAGMYKARMTWTMNDTGYFVEETIQL